MLWRCSVKKCSEKFRKIHRKTPVPESFFKLICNKRGSGTGVLDFEKFLRTLFPTEHLQWLLLTAWTLKNSQSSVTLKNEWKQLGYYFPNEIKNSAHSNRKISGLE